MVTIYTVISFLHYKYIPQFKLSLNKRFAIELIYTLNTKISMDFYITNYIHLYEVNCKIYGGISVWIMRLELSLMNEYISLIYGHLLVSLGSVWLKWFSLPSPFKTAAWLTRMCTDTLLPVHQAPQLWLSRLTRLNQSRLFLNWHYWSAATYNVPFWSLRRLIKLRAAVTNWVTLVTIYSSALHDCLINHSC